MKCGYMYMRVPHLPYKCRLCSERGILSYMFVMHASNWHVVCCVSVGFRRAGALCVAVEFHQVNYYL